jgi:hypothetical protein
MNSKIVWEKVTQPGPVLNGIQQADSAAKPESSSSRREALGRGDA